MRTGNREVVPEKLLRDKRQIVRNTSGGNYTRYVATERKTQKRHNKTFGRARYRRWGEKLDKFEYLRLHMSHIGPWNEVLETRKERCQQALGRFCNFSRITNTLILSHLSYADDTVYVSFIDEQAKQIDSMQAKVLRTILQLPMTTLTQCST